jgi:nicotinamide phosphoribosyltransferase
MSIVCVDPARYKRRMDTSLGAGAVPVEHIEALHDLGYLPICVKALPEGSLVPIKVPALVIYNTHPDFFWLTNYLETILSCYLWKPMTSATVARAYRRLLDRFAEESGADKGFVQFQAHDFSFRGLSGPEDAALSGAAHLTSFVGTDTVSAIDLLEDYYGGDAEKELIGCSVPATEHSVMCMGTNEAEIDTFRRLITQIYPKGIVSIVSDTWDFWGVITEYALTLHQEIMSRDGKLVFRPDSGDPVKIIYGDDDAPEGSPARKGAVECLWGTFGGTTTEKGFRVLDSHVGLIYGDSITLARAEAILSGLKAKGFASNNVVFGVGSYTYQFCTRDTFGFAVKSTYSEVEGVGREIFKDPVTDNGVKKSAHGRLCVTNFDGVYCLADRQDDIDPADCCLRAVFRDGKLLVDDTIAVIRDRLASPDTIEGRQPA